MLKVAPPSESPTAQAYRALFRNGLDDRQTSFRISPPLDSFTGECLSAVLEELKSEGWHIRIQNADNQLEISNIIRFFHTEKEAMEWSKNIQAAQEREYRIAKRVWIAILIFTVIATYLGGK
jgi:hypothetical protein